LQATLLCAAITITATATALVSLARSQDQLILHGFGDCTVVKER